MNDTPFPIKLGGIGRSFNVSIIFNSLEYFTKVSNQYNILSFFEHWLHRVATRRGSNKNWPLSWKSESFSHLCPGNLSNLVILIVKLVNSSS